MRTGLSTIQQTLTPEAASVLNHSIGEAGRRNHGQTTPLHVAATLLASPSGFLRQACIKSHPNSSHPLQCRALELCFSVALERLPTAQNMSPGVEPPISNALMAALKRAQAHQRRGCPEQQQQPLLAVKVELEQLIISILDDPSVSRVMREASFSSPAVKATIEQSLNSSNSVVNSTNLSSVGLNFRSGSGVAATPSQNLYLNPRLQQGGSGSLQSGLQKGEDVKRVLDVLLRAKKRNLVLVGELEPEIVIKEALRRIESKELGDGELKNVEVIRLEKDFAYEKGRILSKVKELGDMVETRMVNLNGGGVVLDLGDLKWLVEHHSCFGTGMVQQFVAEVMRPAVAEIGKMLMKFGEGSGGRVWFVGTATCETYLRCQVYHPSMENDWDLQAMPIATKAPVPGLFPRLGANGILSSSVDTLSPLKGFPTAATISQTHVFENLDTVRRTGCCSQCMQNYEQELKLETKEFEKSSSDAKSESSRPLLPQWLQNAKANDGDVKTKDLSLTKDQELILKQKTQALHKKWVESCVHQHSFCKPIIAPTPPSMTSLYNPKLLGRQPFQPKLQLNSKLGDVLHLNTNPVLCQPADKAGSPPRSPVKTDLVLGRPKFNETTPQKTQTEHPKDFLGCISSEQLNRLHELQSEKPVGALDVDSFKKLLKGLLDKVWWQREAATAVATTVTQCKIGNGKSRGGGSKGDVWLLLSGPDRVGKKKMASALSDVVCGSNTTTISLGSRRNDGESDLSFRGKTALDRIVEAVRRNPCSVIMLEDVDEADMLVRGNIKRAMERGRLADSHGREISIGNVIFILTTDWLPDKLKFLSSGVSLDEEKLVQLARSRWQLKLSLCKKTMKRRANWLNDDDRATKPKKNTTSGLSFDLNEAADVEDDRADGSRNSSDLTNDHEDDHGLDNRRSSTTSSAPREMLNLADDTIVFKPVDFGPIRRDIANSITKKFSTVIKDGITIELHDEALEKILSGVWLGRTGLEEWIDKVLISSFHKLKSHLPSSMKTASGESIIVRLEPDGDSDGRSDGDWLPSSIKVVMADGL